MCIYIHIYIYIEAHASIASSMDVIYFCCSSRCSPMCKVEVRIHAMGSIDGKECRYCIYWVRNPYLYDPDGFALCEWCADHLHLDGSLPDGPNHWWSNRNCCKKMLEKGKILPAHVSGIKPICMLVAQYLLGVDS